MTRLLTALALTLTVSASALAQGTGGTSSATGNQTAGEWDSTISGAFYSDSSAGTLRSESEIRTNWSSLSAEQQAQVRERCASMTASTETPGSGLNSGGAGATPGGTTSAAGSAGSAGTDTTTTSSTEGDERLNSGGAGSTPASEASGSAGMSGGASAQHASMTQLCAMVSGM